MVCHFLTLRDTLFFLKQKLHLNIIPTDKPGFIPNHILDHIYHVPASILLNPTSATSEKEREREHQAIAALDLCIKFLCFCFFFWFCTNKQKENDKLVAELEMSIVISVSNIYSSSSHLLTSSFSLFRPSQLAKPAHLLNKFFKGSSI